MIRPAAILALILLAGCKQQSFDERYKSAQQKLEAKTAAIDRELAAAESDAAQAGALSAGTALPDLPPGQAEPDRPH